MRIWEAIIYGIFGGLTELLPLSFQGHYAFLRGAFNLSPLTENGYFIRAALCLGFMLAIFLSFTVESSAISLELLKMSGLKKRRRKEQGNVLMRRSILLCFFALVPMLCSLIYTTLAERMSSLFYAALLFIVNGLVLFLCFRREPGRKTEKEATVLDTLLLGLGRAVSVFPGLSSVGSSLCMGNVRGLSAQYNLRLAYLLGLFYEFAAFIYYLVRGFLFGNFTAALLLPMLFALIFSGAAGYFAITYLRYLLRHGKLDILSYYSWGLAGIMLFLSLINA